MKKILLIMVSALFLFSCTKEAELELGGLSTSGTIVSQNDNGAELSIGPEAGSASITISANKPWTAEVLNTRADAWISLSATSGKGGEALKISVVENATYSERSATIVIRCEDVSKNIRITQKQKDAVLVSSGKVEIDAEGGTVSIEVQHNIEYSYVIDEACASWIQVAKTKAMTSDNLTFMVSRNQTKERREGKIYFSSAAGRETVTVYQGAKADEGETEKASIVLSKAEYAVSDKGETIEVVVSHNVDVSYECSADWVEPVVTRSMSTDTYQFLVKPNGDVEPRDATITFSSKADGISESVIIHQMQKDALVVAQAHYSVGAEGGTIDIEVGHNIDFEIGIDEDWVTRSETRSYQVEKLTFAVAANTSKDRREAVITFSSKDGSKVQTVTVEQSGIDPVQPDETRFEVTCSAPEITIGYKGCEFTVDVVHNGVRYDVAMDPYVNSGVPFRVNPETLEVDYTFPGLLISDSLFGEEHDVYTFILGASLGKERDCTVTITPDDPRFEPVKIVLHQEEHPDYHVAKALYEQTYDKNCGWNEDMWVNELPGMDRDRLDKDLRVTALSLNSDERKVIKGSLPSCLGDLDHLEDLSIIGGDNSGLVGTLPSSMSKLTRMKTLRIMTSSLEYLPDVFGEWNSLENVAIMSNHKMGGPLPTSLCAGKTVRRAEIEDNEFTGTVPEEWCKSEGYDVFCLMFNRLSGALPQKFFDMPGSSTYFDEILYQKEGYYFDVSNVDAIKGDFPDEKVTDIDGSTYRIGDVVSSSKYTVKLYWATWCPFSKALLPQLKVFYDKYHRDGLEIIAMNPLDYKEGMTNSQLDDIARAEVAAKGYGWRNVSIDKSNIGNYPMLVPAAIVYDSKGNIVFSHSKCRDRKNRFDRPASTDLITFLESKFGPLDDDDYESTDYFWDKAVMPLQTATVGKGINIVLMGDGYTDRDMVDHGLYETLMNQAMEEFFDIEPYKSFRDRFNVYSVKAVSKQGKVKEGSQTALSTYFGEGSFVGGDEEKCYEYASHAFESRENLLVIVLVNGGTTHGTAHMNREDGSAIAFVATNLNERSLFGPTLRHEAAGHGFAKLADEYSNTGSGKVPESVVESYTRDYEELGMWANVDFTSDKFNVKWNSFIRDNRYSGEVGLYEGGATYEKGVWRPSSDSMMNQNAEWFNAPSRLAIYKRIMELSGEGYSWVNFLEYDAINRGASATKARKSSLSPSERKSMVRGHAPVVR